MQVFTFCLFDTNTAGNFFESFCALYFLIETTLLTPRKRTFRFPMNTKRDYQVFNLVLFHLDLTISGNVLVSSLVPINNTGEIFRAKLLSSTIQLVSC